MVRVGINGFGRVGRLVFRAARKNPDVEIVALNDPFFDARYMVDQFHDDSVHGQRYVNARVEDGNLVVDDRTIKVYNCWEPADIPWGTAGVDVVIESSGKFATPEMACLHLKGGAKRVVITASSADEPMYVMGVKKTKSIPRYRTRLQ
eukprot:gene14756-22579_t